MKVFKFSYNVVFALFACGLTIDFVTGAEASFAEQQSPTESLKEEYITEAIFEFPGYASNLQSINSSDSLVENFSDLEHIERGNSGVVVAENIPSVDISIPSQHSQVSVSIDVPFEFAYIDGFASYVDFQQEKYKNVDHVALIGYFPRFNVDTLSSLVADTIEIINPRVIDLSKFEIPDNSHIGAFFDRLSLKLYPLKNIIRLEKLVFTSVIPGDAVVEVVASLRGVSSLLEVVISTNKCDEAMSESIRKAICGSALTISVYDKDSNVSQFDAALCLHSDSALPKIITPRTLRFTNKKIKLPPSILNEIEQ